MDMDLVVIFAFILIAATMVLRFATAAHKRAVDHEERRLELKARRAEAESGMGGAHDRKLEERVRVLERIATDSNHALASQIEELRSLDAIERGQAVTEHAR